ncbi:MAG TPA: hydroxysqualene dehydroxylase HpnE [Acidimicrobiales bacterium]|nr:hydroxysqualene dehydroxylase HpnE [Acidimicrobiales bacterium]
MSGGPLSGRRVAVLGAGLAGLAAALECADLGAQVTLVERRRRLGGLTWSFRHNDLEVDNGQHVYLACCDAYLGFLDRIGAAGDVVPARPLDIPVVAPGPGPGAAPVVGRLRRRDLPVPLHLAGSLLSYPHITVRDRLMLGRALLGLTRLDLDDPALDRITFGEWLSARGQSAEAIAAVWDLITVPTVNLPAAEASLATAAMVFRTGLLSSPAAADMGWSRVPLGRLHGEHAGRALERSGVTVMRQTRVRSVSPLSPEAGWQVDLDGGGLAVDSVVAALPHEEATEVLPAGVVPGQDLWPRLGSSGIVDVHLVFDRHVMTDPVIAGYRSPIQWVFDRSESSGLSSPERGNSQNGRQYLAVSLSAADDLLGRRPESLVADAAREVVRLLPAAREALVVDSLVTKERRATFRAAPGSNRIRPPARTARPGLVLAGAWTATGWPATMEGAVRSGRSAARALAGIGDSSIPAADPAATFIQKLPHVPQEVA